jgi:hypothetical protein
MRTGMNLEYGYDPNITPDDINSQYNRPHTPTFGDHHGTETNLGTRMASDRFVRISGFASRYIVLYRGGVDRTAEVVLLGEITSASGDPRTSLTSGRSGSYEKGEWDCKSMHSGEPRKVLVGLCGVKEETKLLPCGWLALVNAPSVACRI